MHSLNHNYVVKLKYLCRARWIERIDALDHVKKLHSSIVVCFENISIECSCTWSADTVSQVHNVKNYCFVHFFWRFAKLYIFGNVRIYCFGKPMFAFLIVAMATMLED